MTVRKPVAPAVALTNVAEDVSGCGLPVGGAEAEDTDTVGASDALDSAAEPGLDAVWDTDSEADEDVCFGAGSDDVFSGSGFASLDDLGSGALDDAGFGSLDGLGSDAVDDAVLGSGALDDSGSGALDSFSGSGSVPGAAPFLGSGLDSSSSSSSSSFSGAPDEAGAGAAFPDSSGLSALGSLLAVGAGAGAVGASFGAPA